MPRGPRIVVLALLLGFTGCAAVPALLSQTRQEDETVALPTEDGAQYISVTTGRLNSQALVRAKWKRAAQQACQGDYVVLTEEASARRTSGAISGRSHEGYVRCVSPLPADNVAPRAQARAQ